MREEILNIQDVTHLNTFSILARCELTGMLGAASATGRPFVGALLPEVRAESGAVSSQALANPYLALSCIEGLARGLAGEAAINAALENDPGREQRQLAVVSACGGVSAFTGQETVPWAGHQLGDGYVVAGNMLSGHEVLAYMSAAYESQQDQELAERMLRALEAVDATASGDTRGKNSAVLYVAGSEAYGYVDLRVDDHTEPIVELRRLFEIWKKTQRIYQQIMPTRENPAGITDLEEVQRVRDKLRTY